MCDVWWVHEHWQWAMLEQRSQKQEDLERVMGVVWQRARRCRW
jgi:hypothetical protein